MWAFLFLYGVYRFGIEFVRAGVTAEVTGFLGLTTGQIVSLLLALVAGTLFVALGRRAGAAGAPRQPAPVGR